MDSIRMVALVGVVVHPLGAFSIQPNGQSKELNELRSRRFVISSRLLRLADHRLDFDAFQDQYWPFGRPQLNRLFH